MIAAHSLVGLRVLLNQLILPESLKYLPLNVASGLKLDAFGQNTKAVLHRYGSPSSPLYAVCPSCVRLFYMDVTPAQFGDRD